MKIGVFLNKILEASEKEKNNLLDEQNKCREKLSNINKEYMFINSPKLHFEKIVSIICAIYIAALVIGGGFSFFGFISSKLLLAGMATLGLGYLGYKKVDQKISDDIIDKTEKLKKSRLSYEDIVDKCRDKYDKLNKIIEQINNTKRFLEVHQGEYLLEKKLPIEESQLLQYVESDMSLISILYLANTGKLPNKPLSNMTYNELQRIKTLSHDVDRELSNNPLLFFGDEYYQQSKINEKINENLKDESLWIFSDSGVSVINNMAQSNKSFQPIRHRRSDKYLKENQQDEEKRGRRR